MNMVFSLYILYLHYFVIFEKVKGNKIKLNLIKNKLFSKNNYLHSP